jgi:hypothetical protein
MAEQPAVAGHWPPDVEKSPLRVRNLVGPRVCRSWGTGVGRSGVGVAAAGIKLRVAEVIPPRHAPHAQARAGDVMNRLSLARGKDMVCLLNPRVSDGNAPRHLAVAAGEFAAKRVFRRLGRGSEHRQRFRREAAARRSVWRAAARAAGVAKGRGCPHAADKKTARLPWPSHFVAECQPPDQWNAAFAILGAFGPFPFDWNLARPRNAMGGN